MMTEQQDRQQEAGDDTAKKDAEEMTTARRISSLLYSELAATVWEWLESRT